MGKGSFIATVALLVAIAGAIVAFAAYFKHHNCALCDDLDDDVLEDDELCDLNYYATQVDDEDDTEDDTEDDIGDGMEDDCPTEAPETPLSAESPVEEDEL